MPRSSTRNHPENPEDPPQVEADPDPPPDGQILLTPAAFLEALQGQNANIQHQMAGFMQTAQQQFQAQLEQVRAEARLQAQQAADMLDEQRRARDQDRRAMQAELDAVNAASRQQARDFLHAVQQQHQENQTLQQTQVRSSRSSICCKQILLLIMLSNLINSSLLKVCL